MKSTHRTSLIGLLLGLSAISVSAATITPGDIGYWRFESATDSTLTASNLAINALPSTGGSSLFPTTIPQTGVANTKAATFTSSSSVVVNNSKALNYDNLTFEAYISPTGIVSDPTYLITKHNATGTERSWGIGIGSNATNDAVSTKGRLFVALSDTGSTTTTIGSGISLVAGTDYFIAVSIDTEHLNVNFYIKNLFDGKVSNVNQTITLASLNNNTNTSIRLGSVNAGVQQYRGIMDEARLTSGVLDPSQYLIAAVPEPQTVALLFGAIAALFLCAKRLRKK
ncbi:hypothetical protein Ga0100230_019380 [Opitutaceae bacterium TAV3]|nr:hypothetical protein Ga0100230_019380 [Opitutaceae bacterium TAV3]